MEVFGFEGTWIKESPITWGAAALYDKKNKQLINAVTKATCPIENSNDLIQEKKLSRCVSGLKIKKSETKYKSYVLAIHKDFKFWGIFLPNDSNLESLGIIKAIWDTNKEFGNYVFKDIEAFTKYGKATTDIIANTIYFDDSLNDADKEILASIGFILDCHNIKLHLVRCYLMKRNIEFGKAMVLPESKILFDNLNKITPEQFSELIKLCKNM